MIAKIIEYSARNKFIIFLLVVALAVWGYWALTKTPLDALPDLSDTQVIIFTEWQGRSPDLVEDQITYPISSTLLAAPKVQFVRGFSFLGSSFIYVIFDEGTDIYWARSRVLEYLQAVKAKIPADVNPVLGPDATAVGWGFSYAVVDKTGRHDLAELRTIQDYNVKLAIESVPGVSQVASVGGFVKQYQITIDPNRLLAYNIPLMAVTEAVRKSNRDVEGRVLEFSGIEYMIRGRGYIKGLQDLAEIAVSTDGRGTPVLLKDVADVRLGPEIRRGLAELDGQGEVAAGIVVVRFGENVLNVIDRVKERIKNDIVPSLPKGVEIVTTYDRSDLIERSINTLREEIIKLAIAVSVVCIVFLFHLPSALVVILTLPLAILISFICMYYLGLTAQRHEFERYCQRNRRHGGRVDHHGGKRPQKTGSVGRGRETRKPDGCHHRSRPGGRPLAVLRSPGHKRGVSSCFHAPGASWPFVQTPGLHDLCHALLLFWPLR